MIFTTALPEADGTVPFRRRLPTMVRFDDEPTTAVQLDIPAAPEAIWPIVTDITLPVDHSPELQRVEWVDGHTEPAVGARFYGHNRRGDLAWTARCVITELDPPRRFTWVPGHDSEHGAYSAFGFELSPSDDGTTVTQWVRLGPGRSGLTWAIRQNPDQEEQIIEGRLAAFRESMTRNLEEVRRRAVDAAGPTPGVS